jgi:hypothetical protein
MADSNRSQIPDRKPSKEDMRKGGMVATAVLVFLAVFTTIFVLMG